MLAQLAREDVEEFAVNVSSFALIVQMAYDGIQHHCKNHSQSPALHYVQEFDALRDIESQCNRISEHIHAIKPLMRSVQSKIDLLTRLKWVLRKSEVEALHPKMECVKSSLLLLIFVVLLEVKAGQQQTPEIQKEM